MNQIEKMLYQKFKDSKSIKRVIICVTTTNTRQRKQKGKSTMDNLKTMTTLGTQVIARRQ
jgi:hypothetical protein